MFISRQRIYLPLSVLFMFSLLTSCFDENFETSIKEGHVAITGINTRNYEGQDQGDGIDDKVETLRVLAFDKITNVCYSNVFYYGAALTGNILYHSIKQGEYNFIFLCNEPLHQDIKTLLDGINDYDDVKSIAYPTEFFDSNHSIPMIAENKSVKVLAGGKIEVSGIEKTELVVKLRRLAARIDVVLKSKIDFGDINSKLFEGVTFSKLPNCVPLVHGLPSDPMSGSWMYDDPTLAYNGTTITRDVIRKFTLKDDASYFEINPNILTTADKANDLIWAAKVKRVIVPSSYFSTKTAEANAIVFTVNMIKDYSPSCSLKILSTPDYRLPANARLDITAVIKKPLEVNIKPSTWILDKSDWEIVGNRILNVSHAEVKMTDMNGVRISFWSNMPVVKVLSTVKKDGESIERATNDVFNCLTVDDNNPSPYRFYFDPVTGGGYMDLLIDGTNKTIGSGNLHDRTENMSGTYTLTLSAEGDNGENPLQKTIKVKVTQDGLRFVHNPTANAHGLFNGVFYRWNQKGERIITGQHAVDMPWSVEVPTEFRDWLIVSSTPSFDPGVGTDSPGNAENYLVTDNKYKMETGYSIGGLKGRIYFRIGIKPTANFVASKDADPKFGYINLKYRPTGSTWESTMKIYIRQGEAPAYIYRSVDPIPQDVFGGWAGTTLISVREDSRLLPSNTRSSGAAKFSPLNLTTDQLAGNTNPDYDNVDPKGARFVDFPSQAGAFFQWAADLSEASMSTYYRRAYNPTKSWNGQGTQWNYREFPIMWDGDSGAGIPAYKTDFEVCPPGYRRPTDGYTDKRAYNGYYDYLPVEGSSATDFTNYKDEIENSEIRISLFDVPFAGNAASSADYKTVFTGSGNTGPGTYPYGTNGVARKQLKGTTFTFYSDGFFDRRPIKEPSGGNYGVSLGNSRAAYQGVLYFNSVTNASVFFPAAGRLNNTNGNLEGVGSTGYYWSSSVGPAYTRAELIWENYNRTVRYGAWSLEASYNAHNLRVSYQGFAQNIRCVSE